MLPSKADYRAIIKNIHLQYSDTYRKKQENSIKHNILKLISTYKYETCAIYYGTKTEPNLPINDIINMFSTILAPKYINNAYQFVETSTPKLTTTGKFNIQEPTNYKRIETQLLKNPRILFFIPGVAFTENGQRLGHGLGIYDKLLKYTCGINIGVCFNYQQVRSIPTEPHDIQMNHVLFGGSNNT